MPCIASLHALHSMYFMMALGTFFVFFGRVAYKHQTPQHHKILIPSISVEPRKSRQFGVSISSPNQATYLSYVLFSTGKHWPQNNNIYKAAIDQGSGGSM